MGLVRLIRDRFEAAPRLDPRAFRSARPARSPNVTESPQSDGSLILSAPVEPPRGLLGLLASRMNLPATRQFELDPVGSEVWRLCDGKRSFAAIAKSLQTRYKMNRLEAEAALSAYLQTLHRRNLIQIQVKA